MKPKTVQQSWPVRNFALTGFFTLFCLAAGFGSWTVIANLSGAIIVEGRISQERANQLVQHIDSGVVKEIHVQEGDQVFASATLIQLDDKTILSELLILETRLFEVITRKNRREAERDGATNITFDPNLISRAKTDRTVAKMVTGQTRLFNARKISRIQETAALQKKVSQILIQIEGIDAQLSAFEIQLALTDGQLTNQMVLMDKGLARAVTVTDLQHKTAILRGKIGASIAERAEAHAIISSIEIEMLQGVSRRREEAIDRLRDLEFRQSELSENRRALLVRLNGLSIRSPIDGVVFGLASISKDTVIKPAEILMRIAPQNRQYRIETRIAPALVDQIYPGQSVRIVFATLDFEEAVEFSGNIIQISPDVLNDTVTGNTYFEAIVEPSVGTLTQLSERDDIYPGMPVQLYIRTNDQPAWRYLAKPFLGYFTRAFRES